MDRPPQGKAYVMDLFAWIGRELRPTACTSEDLLYEHMDSQSDRCLPIIYQPFDVDNRGHWQDRGAAFDYLYSTQGEGKKLLDFGPGDGWPSLIVAPYVAEVIGVEGAHRRVQVCTENAARLGVANARFVYVPPGAPLPFADNTFDGAMAASSVEQSPDPRATLAEIYRVLRPGGRLRMYYEALGRYRGTAEREAWVWEIDDERCRLMLYDRHTEEEYVVQYALVYALSAKALTAMLAGDGEISFEAITIAGLEQARSVLVEAWVCTTEHPSAKTLLSWLGQIGFRQVLPTHSGSIFARLLFERFDPAHRPRSREALDAYLRPMVEVTAQLFAPIELDPMITALK